MPRFLRLTYTPCSEFAMLLSARLLNQPTDCLSTTIPAFATFLELDTGVILLRDHRPIEYQAIVC